MPKLSEVIDNDLARGAALGIAAAAVAAAAIPAIAIVARPFMRAAIKSGLVFMEKGKETLAEAGEGLEDLVAEVKAELAEAREAVATGAADAKMDFAEVKSENAAVDG